MADDLNPEERARVLIDEQLARAGWYVCDRDQRDLVDHRGNAVQEVIMDAGHGRADYLLYVDRKIVGVIEAKPVGTPLTGVQWQSAMYATGLPEDLKDFAGLREDRLPFVFEASGSETQFTNGFDPSPRARKIFNFPKCVRWSRWPVSSWARRAARSSNVLPPPAQRKLGIVWASGGPAVCVDKASLARAPAYGVQERTMVSVVLSRWDTTPQLINSNSAIAYAPCCAAPVKE